MDQEKHEAIFKLAEDVRRVQGISTFVPEQPLKTIHETCKDELFPKVGTLVEPSHLTFAKILGVLSLLAPPDKGSLPVELVAECRQIIEIHEKGILDDDTVTDVGLAFAAGWQRRPVVGDPIWDSPWAIAVAHLIGAAELITYRILSGFARESISGAPRNFVLPEQMERKAWAELTAIQFVGLQPDSKKMKEQYRRLATWEPGPPDQRSGLMSWLTRALLGSPDTLDKVEANWFRNGLLYDVLAADGITKVEPVAFHLCLSCRSDAKEFGEDACDCGRELNPPSYYVVDKDLLVVPGVYTGMKFRRFVPKNPPDTVKDYIQTEKRKSTGTMRNVYYLDSLPECPHEAIHISQRPTILFVRAWLFPDPSVDSGDIQSIRDDDGRLRIEVTDSSNFVEDLARREQLEQLQKAINSLSENKKRVLVMVKLYGKSIAGVAKEIDLPVWTVEELLDEALLDLRDQLGPGFVSDI